MISFEIGQTFESICYGDSDLRVRWTVIKRTAKFLTVKEQFGGEEKTKKITVRKRGCDDIETCCPDKAGFTYISADEAIQEEIELIEQITEEFELDQVETEYLATVPAHSTVTLVNDEPLLVRDTEDCFIDAEWFNDSKNSRFSRYMKSHKTQQETKVERVVVLTADNFTSYMMSLLDSKSFLKGQGGTESRFPNTAKHIWELTEEEKNQWIAQSYTLAVAVTDGQRLILVDPQGYDYARYVGICGTEGLLNYLNDKHGIRFYRDTFIDQSVEF